MLVRATGWGIYRDRTDLSGTWSNANAPTWPLCDIVADNWTVEQADREVTITWRHGAATAVGSFRGVLVTGDKLTDDRIVGEYTITEAGRRSAAAP